MALKNRLGGSTTHLPYFELKNQSNAFEETKGGKSATVLEREKKEKQTGCLFWIKSFVTTPETPKNKI